jgi:tetratricopeptide (TPR) repeat protein
MSKVGRNAPCPCGSGEKYKKCCLSLKKGKDQVPPVYGRFIPVFTELDKLSNSVMDLIKKNRLDEAEAVSRRLLSEYPDQIDGLERLAQVHEARGENRKAVEYYRKAADFAKSMPGFDQQSVNMYLDFADQVKPEEKGSK